MVQILFIMSTVMQIVSGMSVTAIQSGKVLNHLRVEGRVWASGLVLVILKVCCLSTEMLLQCRSSTEGVGLRKEK